MEIYIIYEDIEGGIENAFLKTLERVDNSVAHMHNLQNINFNVLINGLRINHYSNLIFLSLSVAFTFLPLVRPILEVHIVKLKMSLLLDITGGG